MKFERQIRLKTISLFYIGTKTKI